MAKKWYNLFVSVEPSGETSAGDTASQDPSATDRSAARSVAEIAASLGEPPAFSAPAGDPASFEELYEVAEIHPPAHGYTIFKVAEMLQNEHIRNLPAGVKRSSILLALDAAGVNLQEIIEDAVKRDRALDTYESVQERAVEDLEKQKSQENRRIQEEMERIVAEHRARIQANNDDVARHKDKLHSWHLQKQREEQRIADTVAYFVTENPITTSSPAEPPSKPKGQS